MEFLKFVWEKILNTNFFVAVVTLIAIGVAFKIGVRQNEINQQIGNLQDSVELYASSGVKEIKDVNGKVIYQPFIHIQNVGTRIIYFDRYIFNGKEYDLDGQVRPPTYSQADNNFYWIELPTNGENHVSVVVEYRDIDQRRWKSTVMADFKNGFWDVKTFAREEIK